MKSVILKRASAPSFDRYPFAIPAIRHLYELQLHRKVTYLFSQDAITPVEYEETEHYTVMKDFLDRREKMVEMLLGGSIAISNSQ